MLGANPSCVRGSPSKSHSRKRKGAVLVLAAFLMIAMMAMLAFSVDLGYVTSVKSELKRATDAAALAGAGALVNGMDEAQQRAMEFLVRNPVAHTTLTDQEDWQQHLPELIQQHRDKVTIELGEWDPVTRTFQRSDPSDTLPSTIRVVVNQPNVPLFFGQVLRARERVCTEQGVVDRLIPVNLSAESIARYQPRDIALVLDFSGSMKDDSLLKRIQELGPQVRATVEANLEQIYQELGPPHHGNLQFQPQYVTVVGQPPSGPNMPQITVAFRSSDIYVTSTLDLANVVLQFSDGTKQTFSGLSGKTGTFRGTGGYSNKRIDKAWIKSGQNDSGEGPGYGERFQDDYTTIKNVLGLTSVAYPYPSGSWNDYINYVKTDSYIKTAGYRKMYGYMTLINYWIDQQTKYSQTPDLWKVSEQPVKAVKDAVHVFMDFIQEVETHDRIGLAIFNSPSQTAVLEQGLTEDFALVEDTVRHRQAGHYDLYTNIGAGIQAAHTELEAHARIGAFKMIVLMTDGEANRPTNETTGRNFAIQQAQLVANHHWPIVTISLGNVADLNLMQQIADMTGGIHFNVPGSASIGSYEQALLAVFRKIADARPLTLVK